MSDFIPMSKIELFMNAYSCKYFHHGYPGVVHLFIWYYYGDEGVTIVTEDDDCVHHNDSSVAVQNKAPQISRPIDIVEYFKQESPTRIEFCAFLKRHYHNVTRGAAIKAYQRFGREQLDDDFEGEYIQGSYAWKSTQKDTMIAGKLQYTLNTNKNLGEPEMEKKYNIKPFTEKNICTDGGFTKLWMNYASSIFTGDYIASKQYVNKKDDKFMVAIIKYELRNNDNNTLYGIILYHDTVYKLKSLMTKDEINEEFGIYCHDLPA